MGETSQERGHSSEVLRHTWDLSALNRRSQIGAFSIQRFGSQDAVPLSMNGQFGSRELSLQPPFSVRKRFYPLYHIALSALSIEFSVRKEVSLRIRTATTSIQIAANVKIARNEVLSKGPIN